MKKKILTCFMINLTSIFFIKEEVNAAQEATINVPLMQKVAQEMASLTKGQMREPLALLNSWNTRMTQFSKKLSSEAKSPKAKKAALEKLEELKQRGLSIIHEFYIRDLKGDYTTHFYKVLSEARKAVLKITGETEQEVGHMLSSAKEKSTGGAEKAETFKVSSKLDHPVAGKKPRFADLEAALEDWKKSAHEKIDSSVKASHSKIDAGTVKTMHAHVETGGTQASKLLENAGNKMFTQFSQEVKTTAAKTQKQLDTLAAGAEKSAN